MTEGSANFEITSVVPGITLLASMNQVETLRIRNHNLVLLNLANYESRDVHALVW